MAVRPGTLEHDWNRLYAAFPGDYDKFVSFPHQPRHLDVIRRTVPLDGKTVVDVGSGTGRSSLELARVAERVIGVEPNARMREWAVESATRAGVRNVEFVGGRAEALPFSEAIVDVVAAFWTLFWPPEHAVPAFVAEAVRVLRPGGSLLVVDSPPGWYTGDLSHALGVSDVPYMTTLDRVLGDVGFARFDVDTQQEYGTMDAAVRSFGFIFGRDAIDYLRRTGRHVIRWRTRVHHRSRDPAFS